jgi:hypothetical protein
LNDKLLQENEMLREKISADHTINIQELPKYEPIPELGKKGYSLPSFSSLFKFDRKSDSLKIEDRVIPTKINEPNPKDVSSDSESTIGPLRQNNPYDNPDHPRNIRSSQPSLSPGGAN